MRSKKQERCRKFLCEVVCFGLFAGCTMRAQSPVGVSTIGTELQILNSRAAVVFVGQIVSCQRENSSVAVQFRVEQVIRGSVSSTFTMREWAGFWPDGHVRYMVGQRVLAFVQGASAAGFSSPVHGAEGLVPVVVEGANAPELLDVRRVAASVLRAPGTPLPTEANGAVQLSDALGWIGDIASGAVGQHGLLPVPTRGKKPVLRGGDGVVETGTDPVALGAEPERGPVEEPLAMSRVRVAAEVSSVR